MENCVFCRNPAMMQCQRCWEFYCSAECQAADWKNHKFICVPMPALIKANKSVIKKVLPECAVEVDTVKRSARQNVNITGTPMRLPHIDQEKVTAHADQKTVAEISTNSGNIIQNVFQEEKLIDNQSKEKGNNIEKEKKIIGNEKSTEILNEKVEEIVNDEISSQSSVATNGQGGIVRRSTKIWKTLRPYPNGFFNAVVQHADHKNSILWVSDEDWNKDAMKLLSETNYNVNLIENASKEDVCYGALIIAPFEDIYYRAVVTVEINPFDEIKVRLLDYGNEFFVQYRKCKKANTLVKNFQSMSFPIKYVKKVKIGESIHIRVLEKLNNNIFSVEDMNAVANEEKSDPISPFEINNTSILSTLKSEFFMKAFNRLNINMKRTLGVILQEKDNVLSLLNLNNILNDENKQNYYNILETSVPVGSYIAAQFERNNWRRGLIIGSYKCDYLVLFIDDGKVKVVKDIKRLPEDLRLIPSSTVCVEFKEIKNKKDYLLYTDELTTLVCKFQGNLSNCETLECSVFGENVEIGTATLTHFDGNYKNFMGADTYTYPFRSGDTIFITKIIDYSTLGLTLETLIKYYENIFNEIADSIKLQNSPCKFNIGEVILFKTETTTNYIRGRIVSIIDQSNYEVIHFESECIFKINSRYIKPAPDFVKYCPSILRKVSLYILNLMRTEHQSNKAFETLKKLSKDRKIFFLEWENDLCELFFDAEKTRSLNKQLISELYVKVEEVDDFNIINSEVSESPNAANVKQANNVLTSHQTNYVLTSNQTNDVLTSEQTNNVNLTENKVYKLRDIEVIPLKTGENVRLLVLDTSDIKNGVFTASIDDLEYYKELNTVQQPKITKYCFREDIEKGHNPVPGEVCLSFFEADKQWYRAFCFKAESNNEFTLMFLDFGNVQRCNATKIRKMTNEFLFPCYANTCILLGIPPKLSKSSLEKLKEIIHPDSIIPVDKVEKTGQDQEYLITIRGVEDV